MKKVYELALLFDFYGNLLTDKQQLCFDLYHNNDLSLAEIAEDEGVTRQAIRDFLVRGEATLRDAEEKLGFIKRYAESQETLDAIIEDAAEIYERNRVRTKDPLVATLSERIADRAESLKSTV